MEVEFKENNWFNGVKDIFIRDEKKLLKIFYGANGDLYFDIFGSLNKNENNLYAATFSIKKSEMIYSFFEQLVNDIISCKVFEPCEVRDAERKNEYLKTKQANKKLVDNDTIIWYSDNIYDENANILQIEKDCEEIKLTFIDNPDDPTFGYGIRICNSGSKYDPFNICFMKLFNQFQLLVNEDSLKKVLKNSKR